MRLALSAFLLSTTVLAPAFTPASAADFNATSLVDAVTVYPQGADVTRLARIVLPAGEHRIIMSDLPASVDPRSIRVEGEGSSTLEIASVDTKTHYISQADRDARRKALEKQIAALYDERTNLDQAIADANQQRSFLLGLADRQFLPQSSNEPVKGIDVGQLTGLLDLVGSRLAGLAKSIQEAQARQKTIEERVNEVSMELSALSPADSYRLETVVNVATDADMTGELRISYRLNEAGWMPYYDARMATPVSDGPAKLDIIRRADVMQSTAEGWDNVKLTLSTTRPSGATSAPELDEEELMAQAERDERLRRDLSLNAPAPASEVAADALQNFDDGGTLAGTAKSAGKDKKENEAKLSEQRQAVLVLAGFQANYVVQGRVSVDNTGQAKKVRISSDTQEARLSVISVPRIDPNAYLTATFTVKGEGPMLPGAVNLYRDGVFVGQGAIPLLNPAEEASLGFGIDDLVKIERKEVRKSIGEEGILTSSNVEERAWDISVRNLHKIKMAVQVLDRMPFSATQDIEVEELPGMTKPTEKDYKKRRGVLSWSFDLAPKAENVIKTGYRTTWPQNMRIGLSP